MKILLVFFKAVKFLTVFSDVSVPEIVESVYSVEIVEFAEFTEIVETCGILLKLSFCILIGALYFAVSIECAGALYFSDTNKKFHRDGFLITSHMFEEI